MKKITLLALFGMGFVVAACSSTSVWGGMPYEERTAWQSMGVQYYQAVELRKNAFAPADARPWYQAGIKTPNKILDWYRAGFSPMESSKWQTKGYSVMQAIEYRKKGLTVQ